MFSNLCVNDREKHSTHTDKVRLKVALTQMESRQNVQQKSKWWSLSLSWISVFVIRNSHTFTTGIKKSPGRSVFSPIQPPKENFPSVCGVLPFVCWPVSSPVDLNNGFRVKVYYTKIAGNMGFYIVTSHWKSFGGDLHITATQQTDPLKLRLYNGNQCSTSKMQLFTYQHYLHRFCKINILWVSKKQGKVLK